MADNHGGDSLDPTLQRQGLNRSPPTSLECMAAFRSSGHLFSGGGACLETPEYLLDFIDPDLGTRHQTPDVSLQTCSERCL